MPRTTITPVNSTAHGVLSNVTAADSANGMMFINPNGRAIIEITNGAASNINVTFTPNNTYRITTNVTYNVTNDVQTVVNATTKVFGPFDKTLMNDANSMVYVDFSSGTTVNVRVIEMGSA